jgi:hypothetical protein
MKSLIIAAALVAAIAVPALASPGQEKPWFDLENCAMCKALLAQPGLMDHMTWDNQLINTGMVSVCTVEPAYMDAYKKAGMQMEMVMKDLEAGKTMNLCGMCTSYGALMKAGAKTDEIMSGNTHVMTLTSTDPKVVDGIHTHAQRTIDEYKKMQEMKAAGVKKS